MISFPYPEGTIYPPRSRGFGCTGCVHSMYCPAIRDFRFNYGIEITDNVGITCPSFSSNLSDRVGFPNDDDMDEHDERVRTGLTNILAEYPDDSSGQTSGIFEQNRINF